MFALKGRDKTRERVPFFAPKGLDKLAQGTALGYVGILHPFFLCPKGPNKLALGFGHRPGFRGALPISFFRLEGVQQLQTKAREGV